MRRIAVVLTLVSVGSLGFIGGEAYSSAQQEANYLVMSEFEIGTGQTVNGAIEEASEWVRITRATGKHESVRLFLHDWGPKFSVYMLVQTDWDGVGAIFPDLLAGMPDLFDQPWEFGSHTDNILTEIPVE
jgi:hypothetical protein